MDDIDDIQLLNDQKTLKKPFYTTTAFKIGAAIAAVVVILLVIIIPVSIVASSKKSHKPSPNIILMIGDGFGPASATLARIAGTENGRLIFDDYLVGTLQTYSSSSWVTDSAAGATAYSCAQKTYNRAVAVDSNQVPCGTLLEAAQMKGMKTGLVATSRITHATPASFGSHSVERDYEEFIAKQEVDHKIDVMFGGGRRYFLNGSALLQDALDTGYQVVSTLADFRGPLQTPVMGLFALSHMDFEIDRDPLTQPSLSEMTQRALDLLKDHDKGFFLMVEGSRIDMAGHNNDPACQYHDTIAYANAFETAINFAKQNKNTIVVSVADHETGGLTLGSNYPRNDSYAEYAWYPEVLQKVKKSAESLAALVADGADIAQLMENEAGFVPTAEEIAQIQAAQPSAVIAIGRVISGRALIGWTTKGHTGVDINLYVYGKKTNPLRNNMQNAEIGAWIAETFDLDLQKATDHVRNFSPFPPATSQREARLVADEYHPRF